MKEPGDHSRVSSNFGGQLPQPTGKFQFASHVRDTGGGRAKENPGLGDPGPSITSLRANEAYRGIGVASGA